MAMSAGQDDGEPIMDMNTTPLIDVMLVLLVMFIITIPIQTHAVKVDLPQPTPPTDIIVEPVVNKVFIDTQNQITWNGTPVDQKTLEDLLKRSVAMEPDPELHFQPDPYAPYNTVDEVLAVIKRAKVEKMGFVGNEQYANFNR